MPHPEQQVDYNIRQMMSHVIFATLLHVSIFFVFFFAGEYLIPEPDKSLRYGLLRPDFDYGFKSVDSTTIFPGRPYQVDGDPLYRGLLSIREDEWKQEYGEFPDEASSRHMTFMYALVAFMIVFNMLKGI